MFVGGFIAIDYGSKSMMGGIEAGMPNGGHGKFSDFHVDNLFSWFLSDYDDEYKPSYVNNSMFNSEAGSVIPEDAETNPFFTAE
jgi:hypothetical protein